MASFGENHSPESQGISRSGDHSSWDRNDRGSLLEEIYPEYHWVRFVIGISVRSAHEISSSVRLPRIPLGSFRHRDFGSFGAAIFGSFGAIDHPDCPLSTLLPEGVSDLSMSGGECPPKTSSGRGAGVFCRSWESHRAAGAHVISYVRNRDLIPGSGLARVRQRVHVEAPPECSPRCPPTFLRNTARPRKSIARRRRPPIGSRSSARCSGCCPSTRGRRSSSPT